ncbi:MAG: porin [Kofleriaceae bacterium]
MKASLDMRPIVVVAALTWPVLVGAEPVAPAPEPVATVGGFDLHAGGYLQPQLRLRQDDPVAAFDEDGFRLRRARLTADAVRTLGRVQVTAELEVELTPDTRLLDGSVAVAGCLLDGGGWRLEAGQFRVPVSRQSMMSDSRLALVDKAELASLAPDRQIGVMGTVILPHVPAVRLSTGVWNGEGINQGGNVDQRFLYAGRLEVRALGRAEPLAGSALGGRYLWAGLSGASQRQDSGGAVERQVTVGGELAFGLAGASGTVEYLQVKHTFTGSTQPAYRANGVTAELAYLIPGVPGPGRYEVAARFEEIDRNDTVPIVRIGDPNQSLRYYTGGLSWYVDGHDLKLQATGSHIVEVEDRDAQGRDARYANDTLLVQVTARIR